MKGPVFPPKVLTGFRGNPKVIKEYNQKMALDPELREKMWQFCDASTGAVWK